MFTRSLPIFLLATINIIACFGQEKAPVKFGSVTAKDFNISGLTTDTTNGAVIVADIGQSYFEGNSKGAFSLIFKHKRRIKIINKNGFDLATVKIPLYISSKSDSKEMLEKLKAYTYNLENGKVIETKLSNDAIFEDKYDKNHILKKFTMPAVKEGCIIEYSYTINSDFLFNLHTWDFQGEYPVVWSEYEVDIPEYFDYVQIAQGFQPFVVKSKSSHVGQYSIRTADESASSRSENIQLKGDEAEFHWAMKNVPVLKEEKYTSSVNNYISRIEFQLAGIKYPNQPYKDIMGNWEKVCEELLKDEDFGEALKRNNNWLDDDMKLITAGANSDIEKARKIYYYVRKNIKCTDTRGMWMSKPVKQTFKEKSGSVTEVNMLLTTMLRHENIDADPVILSTTGHGFTNKIYPMMNKFNYVVCQVPMGNSFYYLDASQSYLGFGHLPSYCYNGHARVVNKQASPLYFSPDTLSEGKITNVMLFADEKVAGKWSGNFTTSFGYSESSDIREDINEKGKAGFEKKLVAAYPGGFSISDIEIRDLENYEKPIQLTYKINLATEADNSIIYLNPIIKERYTENDFKSAERKYPVEMPYRIDEMYILYMDIPKGYEVDELPKSAKVTYNDTEGFMEYIISTDGESINMRSRIKMEKTTFSPEEYEALRGFFDYVVKKHSEQIVFKKKAS